PVRSSLRTLLTRERTAIKEEEYEVARSLPSDHVAPPRDAAHCPLGPSSTGGPRTIEDRHDPLARGDGGREGFQGRPEGAGPSRGVRRDERGSGPGRARPTAAGGAEA